MKRLLLPSPEGVPAIWTASPGEKIQPTTAPGPLSGVNLAASDLTGGSEHTLSAASLAFFREVYIDCAGVTENEPGSPPVPANSRRTTDFVV